MASVNFDVEYDDVNRLQQAIINFGKGAEKTINDYLTKEAEQQFTDGIENLIPVSDRNKLHAKTSEPLTGVQEENLSITIKTISKFHYLYFPNEGGFSTNPTAQEFMERGMENKVDDVVNGMLEKLQTNLNNF